MIPTILPMIANVLPAIGALFVANNIYEQVVGSAVQAALVAVGDDSRRSLLMRLLLYVPSLPIRGIWYGIRRLTGANSNASRVLEITLVDTNYQISTGPGFQDLIVGCTVKVVLFGVLVYVAYLTIKFLFLAFKHVYITIENAQIVENYKTNGILPKVNRNGSFTDKF